VWRKEDDKGIAVYRYDVFGRRIWKFDLANRDEPNNFTPMEYYYYDGDRVIELDQTVLAGDPAPGDYTLEECESCPGPLPPPGPPPPPQGSKRIAGTDADKDDVASPLVGDVVGDAKARPGVPTYQLAKDVPAETRADDIYQQIKAAVVTEAASGKQTTVAHSDSDWPGPQPDQDPDAPDTDVQLVREFIYGLDYIDEQVAQVTPDGDLRYVLQDANYNVVAITNDCNEANVVRQFRYTPYGELSATEGRCGVALGSSDYVEAWHLYQGLWYEAGADLYYNRARYYDPTLGRFLQRDPNEQALILTSALSMTGQRAIILLSLSLIVR